MCSKQKSNQISERISLKPLFLSEEEALAMLDLCLMSATETDTTKDRAIMKLTDLVRHFLNEEILFSYGLSVEDIAAVNSEDNAVDESGEAHEEETFGEDAAIPLAVPLCDLSEILDRLDEDYALTLGERLLGDDPYWIGMKKKSSIRSAHILRTMQQYPHLLPQ